MEPDFEVRNLSEYSVEDLQHLLTAIRATEFSVKTFTKPPSEQLHEKTEFLQSLDIWGYRIKDALSQAKKNETIKL